MVTQQQAATFSAIAGGVVFALVLTLGMFMQVKPGRLLFGAIVGALAAFFLMSAAIGIISPVH